MKIDITHEWVDDVIGEIAQDARKLVMKKLFELYDEEMIAHICASKLTDKEKVETYLKHSTQPGVPQPNGRMITVRMQFLSETFGIHVHKMKAIRDELVAGGRAVTTELGNRLAIQYLQVVASPVPVPSVKDATAEK